MVGLDVCHTVGARDTVKTMAQRRRCMRCKTNLLSSTVVRVSFLAWAHIIEVRRLNRVKFSFFFLNLLVLVAVLLSISLRHTFNSRMVCWRIASTAAAAAAAQLAINKIHCHEARPRSTTTTTISQP